MDNIYTPYTPRGEAVRLGASLKYSSIVQGSERKKTYRYYYMLFIVHCNHRNESLHKYIFYNRTGYISNNMHLLLQQIFYKCQVFLLIAKCSVSGMFV